MKTEQINVIKNRPDIKRIEILPNTTVKITWREAVGAERYIIKRSMNSDGDFKKVAVVSGSCFEGIDDTIEHEGIYWYRVVAQRSNGTDKTQKKTCEARSINISSLSAPSLCSIKSDGTKKISFTWENSESCDGYVIFRRHHFMRDAVKIDTVSKDCTSYTDKKVVIGQLLYYSVQSFQNKENIRYSNPSNELCSACIDTPQIIETNRKIGKKVVFSLRLTAGADGYILYKSSSENGDGEEACRSSGLDSLILTDKGKKGEKGAFYSVAAYKKCGDTMIIGKKSFPIFVKYKI